MVKNLPASAGDVGSVPGSGRSPGEGNGSPLRYSCLGNNNTPTFFVYFIILLPIFLYTYI